MKTKFSALMIPIVLALWAVGAHASTVSTVTQYGPGGLGTLAVPSNTAIGNTLTSTGQFKDEYTFTINDPAKLGVATFTLNFSNNDINPLNLSLQNSGGTTLTPDGTQETTGIYRSIALTFSTLAAGTYHLFVNGDALIANSVYQGQIQLSAVPLPGSLGLFITALGLLVFWRLRPKPKSASLV